MSSGFSDYASIQHQVANRNYTNPLTHPKLFRAEDWLRENVEARCSSVYVGVTSAVESFFWHGFHAIDEAARGVVGLDSSRLKPCLRHVVNTVAVPVTKIGLGVFGFFSPNKAWKIAKSINSNQSVRKQLAFDTRAEYRNPISGRLLAPIRGTAFGVYNIAQGVVTFANSFFQSHTLKEMEKSINQVAAGVLSFKWGICGIFSSNDRLELDIYKKFDKFI